MLLRDKYAKLRGAPDPVRFLWTRMLGQFLLRTHLCQAATIPQRGFALRFYPSSLSYTLWKDPHDRDDDVDFILTYLRPGDTMVDVGANVGNLTLAASVAVREQGRVYAIEAHPRIFRYLQGNIRLNRARNVVPLRTAAGAAKNTVAFSDIDSDDQNCVVGSESSAINVAMRPLDELAPPSTIALLKVDVEGYEKFVFEGAADVLSRTLCVYFEASEENFARNGYATRDILDLLTGAGFSVYRKQGRQLAPVLPDFIPEQLLNLIAVKCLDDFVVRTGLSMPMPVQRH